MAEELDELIEFLCDDRPEVKAMAVDIVKGLTGSDDGLEQLKRKSASLLPLLLRLTNDAQPSVSEGACTALVNLSQDVTVVQRLLGFGVVERVLDYIREGSCTERDKLMMLLSNVTQTEEGTRAMLQLGKGKLEGLHIARLLGMLLQGSPAEKETGVDDMEHMANILVNVTRIIDGRKMLLEPGRGIVKALASQLKPEKSRLRRIGCANALRNCFYTCRADGTLQWILEAKDALPDILQPISGVEPKELEDEVREAIAESVLMLAAEEEGREALLEIDGHLTLKKGYELEEHPGTCEAMERTAVIFMTKGQVEPADGEEMPESESGDHEVNVQVIPGGFSLG